MSVFPGSNNSIVYAQFNMQGRWRRLLLVAGVYGLLMGVAIWLTTLASTTFHPRDLEAWVGGITALQVLNLLVFGSFRVESAVRGDVTSRMLESHRLMPAPPLGSILGYLFGAPLQAILLAAVNFVLGSVCCVICGISLNAWAMLNGILFFFALVVYAVIAQFSFIARGGFILLIIAGGMSIGGAGNEVLQLLPSASVLLFPLLSRSSVFAQVFNGSSATFSADISFAYLMALAGQAAIGAIAIRVAIRRYLSSSIIGLSAPLGLLLLIIWVALAMVQFSWPDTFFMRRYLSRPGYSHQELVTQTMASFITSALLAMFPIASAARASRLWHRTGDTTGTKPRWHLSEWVTAVLATAIVCLLMINPPLHIDGQISSKSMTALIFLNFSIAVACVFSWGYLLRTRAWIFAVIWVLLTWLVPVIADAIYHAMTDSTSDAGVLTAVSPPGALALIWSNSSVAVFPGIAVQIALSSIPAGLLLFTHARRRIAR